MKALTLFPAVIMVQICLHVVLGAKGHDSSDGNRVLSLPIGTLVRAQEEYLIVRVAEDALLTVL